MTESIIKFVQKYVYFSINLFTLNASLRFFHSVHQKRRWPCWIYNFFQLLGLSSVLRLFFYTVYLKYGNNEWAKPLEPSLFKMIKMTRNKYIFISFACYLFHVINCFHFNSRQLFEMIKNYKIDLFLLIDYLSRNRNNLKFKFNPYIRMFDTAKIVRMFEMLQRSFFIQMVCLSIFLTTIMPLVLLMFFSMDSTLSVLIAIRNLLDC